MLRLFWKSRRLPSYRHRIAERFSLSNKELTPVDLWVHAVSLGEVVAVTPLIEALLEKEWRVCVTTMTPTGSEQVSKRFGHRVGHQYLPYDLPWAIQRFFNTIKPRVGLIMETEIWPNLIYKAKKMNIPLLLANARLSDHSFKSYEKYKYLFKPVLNQMTTILAQSHEDAKRFLSLGVRKELVQVFGNMKFDVEYTFSENKECRQCKEQWGEGRVVFIAASTHDDEESQLLSQFHRLKNNIPNLLFLIVPRHPERFQWVYQLCKNQGLNTGLRSQPSTIDPSIEVMVIDSLGELLQFYQMSDYAFVGGSLVPVGGHNVLEPISVKVPVFCGPYMNNSKEICRDLVNKGGLVIAEDLDQLIGALIEMHQNPTKKQQQITNALEVLTANRGTVGRYLEKIEAYAR